MENSIPQLFSILETNKHLFSVYKENMKNVNGAKFSQKFLLIQTEIVKVFQQIFMTSISCPSC